jgi:arginine:ornithine antiporter/lysine permease
VLFILARREQHAKLFASAEWVLFLAVLAVAAYGIYGLATGMINI